jgi:hypothetical protein
MTEAVFTAVPTSTSNTLGGNVARASRSLLTIRLDLGGKFLSVQCKVSPVLKLKRGGARRDNLLTHAMARRVISTAARRGRAFQSHVRLCVNSSGGRWLVRAAPLLPRSRLELGPPSKMAAYFCSLRSPAVVHIRDAMAIDPSNDYFVILKRQLRGGITLWSYEINRRSKPLGVKIQEGEFSTPQAAKQAGDAALRELLRELTQGNGEN